MIYQQHHQLNLLIAREAGHGILLFLIIISLSKCSPRPSLISGVLLVKKKKYSKSDERLYLIKQLHIFIIKL